MPVVGGITFSGMYCAAHRTHYTDINDHFIMTPGEGVKCTPGARATCSCRPGYLSILSTSCSGNGCYGSKIICVKPN
jgi:hypothetical protein